MSTNGAVAWATIGRIVVAGLGIWIVIETWRIWLLLLIAAIVAAAIMPAARWGDRYCIPRIMAVSGVYLGAAVIMAVLVNLLVPAFIEQGTQFAFQLPALIENIKGWAARFVAWGARWEIPIPDLSIGGEGVLAGSGSSWSRTRCAQRPV